MTVQMMVMNMAEGARAVGNSKAITTAIPKTSISYTALYFTANVSGATSANVQCSPSGFVGGLKANTLANTPAILVTGLPVFHTYHYTQFLSGAIQSTAFVVKLYAGNTACANAGATVYPPNTTLQRVITIADAGSDAGGNTWGGYREWDVADATISLSNGTAAGYANSVVYTWSLPGGTTSNTGRPWQFTTSATDIANVTIIYQH